MERDSPDLFEENLFAVGDNVRTRVTENSTKDDEARE